MIIPTQSLQATADEIEKLKSLVRKPILLGKKNLNQSQPKPKPAPINVVNGIAPEAEPRRNYKLFDGSIRSVEITMAPLALDNPVELWTLLKPDVELYRWQFETLMQIGGYLKVGCYKPEDKTVIDKNAPFRLLLPAANGSGKDAIVIAASTVWYVLTGIRNRAIVTSSSFEQTKFQTEPAIRDLTAKVNSKFGPLFKSIQFHHVVPKLGSEIKMFATDDPGHAEGYHAWDNGGIMRIVNEAKSVKPDIFKAMSRWTGVSHDMCVSSPGPKSGDMYNRVADCLQYPSDVVLNKWYLRRVTAFECKHLTAAHIQNIFHEYGQDSPHTKSVIFAEFSDYGEPVIISEATYDKLLKSPPLEQGHDIGIGLDLAGGGDEDAGFVRIGNRVLHSFFFRQKDTDLAADLIDIQLEPWKNTDYTFNADNGGIGQAILDKLAQKNWNIRRRNNQSPAFDKRQFLNLGAEVWHYVKRLIERSEIILPKKIDKLREQMTTRQWEGLESTQGKFALEPKPVAKACGRVSPDRADAFNLCFFSYRPGTTIIKVDPEAKTYIDTKELIRRAQTGELWKEFKRGGIGIYTAMNSKNI